MTEIREADLKFTEQIKFKIGPFIDSKLQLRIRTGNDRNGTETRRPRSSPKIDEPRIETNGDGKTEHRFVDSNLTSDLRATGHNIVSNSSELHTFETKSRNQNQRERSRKFSVEDRF